MSRNGNPNIISFDDAKRIASERSERMSVEVMSEAVGETLPRMAGPQASATVARPARGIGGGYSSFSVGAGSVSSRSSRDISLAGSARPAKISFDQTDAQAARERLAARREARDAGIVRDSRRSSSAAAPVASSRAAVEVYDEISAYEDDARTGRGRAADKKRAKIKQKADRLFMRQFGADEPAPSPHASRAAVYKGEMGRSHKRAFADLGGTKASAASSTRGSYASSAAATKGITASPLFIAVGVLLSVVLALAFLYPTAKQYYVESREQARLQAEYDALSARNQAIEDKIAYLKTDEGIEDAAHTELGWVYDGQVSGIVQGLDSQSSSTTGGDVVAQVKSGTVPAPVTWYTPFLDAIFGYVDPATVVPDNTDVSTVNDAAVSGATTESSAS